MPHATGTYTFPLSCLLGTREKARLIVYNSGSQGSLFLHACMLLKYSNKTHAQITLTGTYAELAMNNIPVAP